MNYVTIGTIVVKLIPCVIGVIKGIDEAKTDDGEVDLVEGVQVGQDFIECTIKSMGLKVKDA